MMAFKREIVRSLGEYTGRPDLFKRIKWVDGNPLMATHEYLGFTLDYINKTSKNDNHLNDLVLANYAYLDDTIFMKTPTETIINDLCLHPDVYTETLRNMLHEVAHRIQYYNGYRDHRNTVTIHGKEFQEACLELGLVPSIEAYDIHNYIEHDPDASDFYVWATHEGLYHFDTAFSKTTDSWKKKNIVAIQNDLKNLNNSWNNEKGGL